MASVLSPQSQILPNVALALGNIPLLIGINGLLKPAGLIGSVGFHVPSEPEARKVTDGLTRLFCLRNVVIGLTCSGIWYSGDRKLLGLFMLILSGEAFVDGLINIFPTRPSSYTYP